MLKFFGASLLVLTLASISLADSIYGTCKHKDGSNAGGSVGISTSWNGKRTSPSNGKYTLDFGGKVGKTITVYANGTSVGKVFVSGNTKFDIVVP